MKRPPLRRMKNPRSRFRRSRPTDDDEEPEAKPSRRARDEDPEDEEPAPRQGIRERLAARRSGGMGGKPAEDDD